MENLGNEIRKAHQENNRNRTTENHLRSLNNTTEHTNTIRSRLEDHVLNLSSSWKSEIRRLDSSIQSLVKSLNTFTTVLSRSSFITDTSAIPEPPTTPHPLENRRHKYPYDNSPNDNLHHSPAKSTYDDHDDSRFSPVLETEEPPADITNHETPAKSTTQPEQQASSTAEAKPESSKPKTTSVKRIQHQQQEMPPPLFHPTSTNRPTSRCTPARRFTSAPYSRDNYSIHRRRYSYQGGYRNLIRRSIDRTVHRHHYH